jgi:hypothetical protein
MIWMSMIVVPVSWVLGDVAVKMSSDSRLELLVEVSGIEDVGDAAGRWTGIRVPGYHSVFEDSIGVHVPVRAHLLAAPLGSRVTCDVTEATYYNIERYVVDDVVNSLAGRLGEVPRNAAEITTDGFFRHQRIVGLRIAPLVYDEATGDLRIYTRYKVIIGFTGGDGPRLRSAAAPGREPGPHEAAFRAALLNYEQGRMWRQAPVSRVEPDDYYSDSSVWLKVKVDTSGIFRITGEDLEASGIGLSGIEPGTIRMYSGGGLPLEESLADTAAVWMEQVPVKVCDGGDGSFGRGDSILFYGLGARDWADLYDRNKLSDAYYKSFFSTYNCYWLTWGGSFDQEARRMDVVDLPDCDGCTYYQPASFQERIHVEADVFPNFGVHAEDGWYWQPLRTDSWALFRPMTPSPDTDSSATVKVRVANWAASDECTGDYYRVILEFNNTAVQDTQWSAGKPSRGVIDIEGSGIPSGSDQQTIGMVAPSALLLPNQDDGVCKKLDLAWYEIHYWRKFEAHDDALFFRSPDSTCTARFDIAGFTGPAVYAFDISDQFDVRELRGLGLSSGPPYSVTFFDTVKDESVRRYAVVSAGALLGPSEIDQASIANIRSRPARAYCVVTHEDLIAAATTIADFHDGEIVTTDQIYDEFGWGVPDVTAIRDFLRWRYQTHELEWVLILGDATWDYKGYLGDGGFPNYVPSYERRYLPPTSESYNTDDWFAYLEPVWQGSTAHYPMVGISRLPASSPEEAVGLVSRAIDYTSDPEIGPWQNRVILVADDDRTPSGCDGIPHTRYVEELADEAYPPVFEQAKVYLTEYPRDPNGLKPEARDDFIKHLNEGALVTNFAGHGDENRWTQEEVFSPSAIALVNNGRRRTLVIAASCNVSRFDEPSRSSVAEELLRRSEGGTIGSLASTHLCPAPLNQTLNLNFLYQLFADGYRQSLVPVADAAALAKFLGVAGLANPSRTMVNNEKYALFGDPAMVLAVPRYDVVFDAAAPDTLARKGVYDLSATIREGTEPAGWLQGSAEIYTREGEDTTGYAGCNESFFDYEIPGQEIFRGRAPVTGDSFEFGFFVRSGAREGPRATIRCFATDGQSAASGLLDSLVMYGLGASDDDDGPEIELVADGRSIESGDTLVVGTRVDVNLNDESGVAVKGQSEFIPSVSVAFDDVERLNLTDSVYSIDGDFTQSVVSFLVPPLPSGMHRLSIAAFDNVNNLTTSEYDVFIGTQAIGVGNVVYVYPNPGHGVCYIIWDYENDKYVEVEATIYTVSGRKIWTGTASGESSYIEIMWDGTDVAGDPVANGTYLAVVEAASTLEPGFSTSDRIAITIVR